MFNKCLHALIKYKKKQEKKKIMKLNINCTTTFDHDEEFYTKQFQIILVSAIMCLWFLQQIIIFFFSNLIFILLLKIYFFLLSDLFLKINLFIFYTPTHKTEKYWWLLLDIIKFGLLLSITSAMRITKIRIPLRSERVSEYTLHHNALFGGWLFLFKVYYWKLYF